MQVHRFIVPLLACGALAFGVAACGDDDETGGSAGGGSGEKLSGSIQIDGSSTVAPFAQAAAEQFKADNPDVKITVGTSGTGGGFEKFCEGETDISDASRPIKDDEEAPICKKSGVEYAEVQVANDGLAVATNPALEIDCMTVAELKTLWQDSEVKNYKDIDPKFPDQKVSLFGAGTDSGTFDYFTDEINGEEGEDPQGLPAVRGRQRARPGRGRRQGRPRVLRVLLLRAEQGQAQPRRGRCRRWLRQALQGERPGRQYKPLSRPLFMYPSQKALRRPEVDAFMEYLIDN